MSNRIKWGDSVTGLDGVIAASQAVKDGKSVMRLDSDGWVDAYGHTFNTHYTYRIGEEVKLREFWVNVYGFGYAGPYKSRREADNVQGSDRIECIRFREVAK